MQFSPIETPQLDEPVSRATGESKSRFVMYIPCNAYDFAAVSNPLGENLLEFTLYSCQYLWVKDAKPFTLDWFQSARYPRAVPNTKMFCWSSLRLAQTIALGGPRSS